MEVLLAEVYYSYVCITPLVSNAGAPVQVSSGDMDVEQTHLWAPAVLLGLALFAVDEASFGDPSKTGGGWFKQ